MVREQLYDKLGYNDPRIKQFEDEIKERSANRTWDIQTPERIQLRNNMVQNYFNIYGQNVKKTKPSLL